jgi:hypothetical protein
MAALDVRLRVASPGLVSLPWRRPLAEWDPTAVAFRDVPVGPSRHLVRFVEADGRLWALKALPRRTALHEYEMLRVAETRALAAVRAAGVVLQQRDDDAVLVTAYLERSWQYRRLLMRIAPDATVHRARLFDAMASLLVDLHRNGIWWGDCSLANTLFTRDGQVIQAWLVDAETAESHPSLSEGQRAADLEIMVENVAGGLVDVSARRGEMEGSHERALVEATSIAERYGQLWSLLHDRPRAGEDPTGVMASRVRDLESVGFAVDEVRLRADDEDDGVGDLRLSVAVGGRRFHAEQFRALTGLDVGEGQARVLLSDLRDHRARWEHERGGSLTEVMAAREWVLTVFTPGAERAHAAVHHLGDPVQAYCDLLEVRWILSERAGYDVGDGPALEALARRVLPGGSAAEAAFVDLPTEELPVVRLDDP